MEVGLEIAARLAQSVDGCLTVVHETETVAPAEEGASAARLQRAGISSSQTALLDRLHVRLQVSEAPDAVAAACRLAAADRGVVVMIARREAEVATALVDSGLPVLAVPRAATSFDPAGEALILWDGARSASHALVAALPLLQGARRVTVLEIDDGSLRRSGHEAVALLSRHGISAHLRHDLAYGEKAGLILLEQIATLRPAYVVMGGFGHARWIENTIGGVTRRLLAECNVPLFLKH